MVTVASDNPYPSILMVEGDPEALAANPASGQRRLAVGTDHLLYLVDDTGTATLVGASSGSVATDAIWDAAGDLVQGTGADTAARLGIGTAGQLLRVNSGATAVEWASIAAGADVSASGDTTIVNANTYYDGPSTASLAVGNWLILWKCIVQVIVSTAQAYTWQARVWDGSTIYDEAESGVTSSGNQINNSWFMSGAFIVTLGSPTALKISAACIRGSSASKIARNIVTNTGSSNLPTRIVAVRLA